MLAKANAHHAVAATISVVNTGATYCSGWRRGLWMGSGAGGGGVSTATSVFKFKVADSSGSAASLKMVGGTLVMVSVVGVGASGVGSMAFGR